MKYRPHLKLRNILSFVGLLGLALLIVLDRHLLESFWHLIKTIRWYVVVLMIFIELFSFYLNALYYRSILRIFSYEVGVRRLFEGALATNFVNYVIPTAGIAGAGYLSQVLSPEVPRGEGVLTQIMRYALSSLAILIMMPVGVLLIFLGHDAAHPVIRVAILSALSITILGVFIVAIVQREAMLRRMIHWLEGKLRQRFTKLKNRSLDRLLDEFYVGYRAMTRQKRRMLIPFAWSLVYIVVQICMLYVGFLAFGKTLNPGIVIMAYLFGNIVSIFGGALFSTGTFEVGMAGTLVALGSSFALAISVTTVYRVLSLLAGLPLGFIYYRKYLP